MQIPEVGAKAPHFSGPDENGATISLDQFKGQKLVLYFYPKDNTPGCTTEACDFQENMTQFNNLNAAVVGVSRDSQAKHQKFKERYGLNFPLIADEEGEVCQAYGVWVEKSMFGKKYFGIQRATFLINEEGVITHVWPKVKVSSHTQEVLSALNA